MSVYAGRPIDENTASLIVPFEDQERTFTVHFDPESGMIDTMETMRLPRG